MWIFHLFVARSIKTAAYTESWKREVALGNLRKPDYMKKSSYKN